MTIVFGTETVRTFDRLEAMSNRTVGVAKRCADRNQRTPGAQTWG